MKRILIFKYNDGFIFEENGIVLFKIDKNQLTLDSKLIYEKIYKGIYQNQEIEVVNKFEEIGDKRIDSLAKIIYSNVYKLLTDINNELIKQSVFK